MTRILFAFFLGLAATHTLAQEAEIQQQAQQVQIMQNEKEGQIREPASIQIEDSNHDLEKVEGFLENHDY